MANTETMTVRMARMEEKTSNIQKQVKSIDQKQDVILEKFDNLDNRYPTRREFATAKWLIGAVFTILGIVIAVLK